MPKQTISVMWVFRTNDEINCEKWGSIVLQGDFQNISISLWQINNFYLQICAIEDGKPKLISSK